MWGSYGAGSQCVGVAVYDNCDMWESQWTSCSENKFVNTKISLYSRDKSFAGSSLPAETIALPIDRWTDGPTEGHSILKSRGSRLKIIVGKDCKLSWIHSSNVS